MTVVLRLLGALLGGAALARANTPVPESIFTDSFQNLAGALAAAPMWMLPGGTCFPSAAVWDGVQNSGNAPDNCNILKLDHNCPAQPDQNGHDNQVEAHPFPTYYINRKCADGTWRVLYDVYFTKDTGHRHDWEWAIVVWRPWNEVDASKFVRWGVHLQQDKGHQWIEWDKIQNTIVDDGDYLSFGGQDKDHAKLYFGKFHHPVWDDTQSYFPDTCPPNSEHDFRSNDYQYRSSQWLVDGTQIPDGWNWGDASSFPASFWQGHANDICNF